MAQIQATVDSLNAKLASLKADQAKMTAELCSEMEKLATLKAQEKLKNGADLITSGFGVHGDWSLYEKMAETKDKIKEIFDKLNKDSVEEISTLIAELAVKGESD